MANAKEFSLGYEAGPTVYLTVQRKQDGYLLDDADGVFRIPPVADFAVAMTPDAEQPAVFEVSEARTSWQDGLYLVAFYEQLDASPDPSTDLLVASVEVSLADDAIQTDADIISSVTNISTTVNGSGAAGDTAELMKLVKAILHDNKMVLDTVEFLKGQSNGNRASHRSEKAGSPGIGIHPGAGRRR